VDIHGEMPPMGKFDVAGLGSQFDATLPYLDGYQIMPRYKSDIKLITSTQSGSGAAVTISPNPGQGHFVIRTELPFERLEILNLQGQLLYSEPYNQNLSLTLPNGFYWLRLHGHNPVFLRLMIQR
ncbi:MAG TPA: hypothetical protein VFX48_01015, partial [Saprospiraceae bacterium]|nr:hypothetical protein [Saprospiraceae bacterium]